MFFLRSISISILLVAVLFGVNGISVNVGRTAPQCQKVYTRPSSVFIYDDYKCKSGNNQPRGDLMFGYYGEDSQCWELEGKQKQEECYKRTPYGGIGTFQIGGNYVLEEANYLKLGSDHAGYHWLMTTTTEPMGNAIGIKANAEGVKFGDNVVARGNLHVKKTDKKDIRIGSDESGEESFYVNTKYQGEEQEIDFNDIFKIYGRELGTTNPQGKKKYRGSSVLDFKSLLKFNDKGYLHDEDGEIEEVYKYRADFAEVYKYRTENISYFYDKYNNTDEEVVKNDCSSDSWMPGDPCSPQPYKQYKVMDYSATGGTEGRTSGVSGTVRCMEENCTDCKGGVYVSKPAERDNISCKACGDSSNSHPLGCTDAPHQVGPEGRND